MSYKTIAAIATGMSNAGISIIRISGPRAIEIADSIFVYGEGKKLSYSVSHMLHYGHVIFQEKIIDEAMGVLMRAPRSYTMEDYVELQVHGGAFVTNRVLEAVVSCGASVAEPGEFTKRAFLNGRIDLTEAEAVMDVISAENSFALDCSENQLNGLLKNNITSLRESILLETAFIESALDDPEHYSLDGYSVKLDGKLNDIIIKLKTLLDSFDDGRIVRDGIRTVIVGKPNAGKSSVLNLLTGSERAIVTSVPGTTRDVLEENVKLGALKLVMADTAGIHETKDIVEKIGIDRAKNEVRKADLVLFVVDGADEFDDEDEEALSLIKDKKVVILLNKSDLLIKTTVEDISKITDFPVVLISAKEGTGREKLVDLLNKMFINGEIDYNNQVFLTNVRQKNCITEALECIGRVRESINSGMPEDFFNIDLMDAYTALGKCIGESVGEDLINEIFKKFCMGK